MTEKKPKEKQQIYLGDGLAVDVYGPLVVMRKGYNEIMLSTERVLKLAKFIEAYESDEVGE